MQYPLISEYVAAILDAADNLNQLAHLRPVLDAHGEPHRSSGAFAVVFKMEDPTTGKHYALKCFTEEQAERNEAYRAIASELDTIDVPYFANLQFFEDELFVDSPSCTTEEFPVLLMDWVEGKTMESFIAEHAQDAPQMAWLCFRFCKMAAWLRAQPLAHGDLKPDNIMVRPDGTLTLVDYDGCFVPALRGHVSPTLGTKDFTHPLRRADLFDETIDDFALASMALSLKAMSLDPALYARFGASDRLLFSQTDYLDLSKSETLRALSTLLYDKELCRLYALFLLCYTDTNLAASSFRLFHLEKPQVQIQVVVPSLSTVATDEDIVDGIEDEFGGVYSKDGKRFLKFRKGDSAYTIKEGVQVICDGAFRGCSSLSSLDLPDGITHIGNSAFWGSSSLSSLYLPDSITHIGDCAFWDCSSLSSLYLPDGITHIGDYTFCDCFSLSSLSLPDGITHIGYCAFWGCSSLSSLSLPNGIIHIGEDAFEGCSSLSSPIIPQGSREKFL